MLTFLPMSWGELLLLIAQAGNSERVADGIQYLILTGIVAVIVLIYRIDHRVARLELTLNDPDRGIVPEMKTTRLWRHRSRNLLDRHNYRLQALERQTELPVHDDADVQEDPST